MLAKEVMERGDSKIRVSVKVGSDLGSSFYDNDTLGNKSPHKSPLLEAQPLLDLAGLKDMVEMVSQDPPDVPSVITAT